MTKIIVPGITRCLCRRSRVLWKEGISRTAGTKPIPVEPAVSTNQTQSGGGWLPESDSVLLHWEFEKGCINV
jgi:hypothetical protein